MVPSSAISPPIPTQTPPLASQSQHTSRPQKSIQQWQHNNQRPKRGPAAQIYLSKICDLLGVQYPMPTPPKPGASGVQNPTPKSQLRYEADATIENSLPPAPARDPRTPVGCHQHQVTNSLRRGLEIWTATQKSERRSRPPFISPLVFSLHLFPAMSGFPRRIALHASYADNRFVQAGHRTLNAFCQFSSKSLLPDILPYRSPLAPLARGFSLFYNESVA